MTPLKTVKLTRVMVESVLEQAPPPASYDSMSRLRRPVENLSDARAKCSEPIEKSRKQWEKFNNYSLAALAVCGVVTFGLLCGSAGETACLIAGGLTIGAFIALVVTTVFYKRRAWALAALVRLEKEIRGGPKNAETWERLEGARERINAALRRIETVKTPQSRELAEGYRALAKLIVARQESIIKRITPPGHAAVHSGTADTGRQIDITKVNYVKVDFSPKGEVTVDSSTTVVRTLRPNRDVYKSLNI